MLPSIHPAAARGFEAGARRYAASRPEYPVAVEAWLRAELRLGTGRRVLDLGSGTGKFLPRLEASGAHVVAVEPVAAMCAELAAGHPGVNLVRSAATHIPLRDGCADAVTCAQSFHWFASAEALEEIRRVLRPGGWLGLVWNMRDERVEWVAELTRLLEPYEGGAPRYRSGQWRQAFPARGFGSLREASFPHQQEGEPEVVIVQRMLSTSFVSALPKAQQDDIAGAIRAVIARTPALAGKARVRFPYVTGAYCCQRV
ncbi:MAG: class I SAM-dependent methyltransferase [Terriglobales bacterium]